MAREADAAEGQFDPAAGAVVVEEDLARRCSRFASRICRAPFSVQTLATRPKPVPLAMATASSSVSNGIATCTGPKISSCASGWSGGTSANRVAGT